MKTLLRTEPFLIAADTESGPRKPPKGHVHVLCVRFETYEIPVNEFTDLRFNLMDPTCRHAKIIERLVNHNE